MRIKILTSELNKRLLILLCLFLILLIIYIYSNTTKEEYIIKKFVKIYLDSKVHDKTTWLGVKIIQNPCDVWAIQEIITEIKPDFIIETGTLWGGSAIYFASILQNVNKNGKVITVDIAEDVDDYIEKASKLKLFQDYVELIKGDCVSKEVINKIANRIKGASKVIVMLDSDHNKNHVLKELELYSQFVSLNSYLIIHDTHLDGWNIKKNFEGPMEATEDFLKRNSNFIADRLREKFLLTLSPKGYLKRIR